MKKHVSVWSLLARSVLWPLLAIALAVSAVQAALFAAALYTVPSTEWGGGLPVFEYLVARSGLAVVSGMGLAALCVVLCRCCAGGGSRPLYTLRRLAVSESWFFWQQAAVSILAVLIYWGLQLGTVLALGAWYLQRPQAAGGVSALPLAFWRSAFLHGLLPTADTLRWAANLLLLPALGLCAAAWAQCRRHQRRSLFIAAAAPMVMISFMLGYDEADAWLALAVGSAIMAAAAVVQALQEDADDDG